MLVPRCVIYKFRDGADGASTITRYVKITSTKKPLNYLRSQRLATILQNFDIPKKENDSISENVLNDIENKNACNDFMNIKKG